MSQPEKICFEKLLARGLTFAAAESCTGGLIAKRMTDLAGASKVFRGGVVSYWSSVKADVLGVPEALLGVNGAVSEPVARAMAEGVCTVTGAEAGVSVTGVAGPDRDDRGNKVGTVYIAVSLRGKTDCRRFDFGEKSRAEIRTAAADEAFSMLAGAL